MRSKANHEQILAIETLGDMVLSAGAGAGKTYVLVENLIFRLEDFYNNELNSFWDQSRLKNLQEKLLKIIIVTFTKKAASELFVRVEKRLKLEIDSQENKNIKFFWENVIENLYLLNVSTIHSYCQKILSQNSVHLPISKIELLNEFAYREKIKKLFQEFLEVKKITDEDLLVFKNDAEKAVVKIFEDVELRMKWSSDKKLNLNEELKNLILKMIEIYSFEEFVSFKKIHISEKEKGKWVELIEKYNDLCDKRVDVSFEFLANCFDVLNVRKPVTKNVDVDFVKAIEMIDHFNKTFKSIYESWIVLDEHKDKILKLHDFIRLAFQYVNENFYTTIGMSFNDLEYLIIKEFNRPEIKKMISDQVDIIVVDEYQDTSNVQFEILKILTNGDFSKIITVGDLKQAIYGFRGGEVDVFIETTNLVKNNLALNYNYRSRSGVVHFNNRLFEQVFPMGLDFEKKDRHQFQYVGQHVPESNGDDEVQAKCIHSRNVFIDVADSKFSTAKLNQVEAEEFFDLIIKDIEENVGSIAVLYRKLSPAEPLIKILQKNKIKYSAQLKIQFKDEPIYILTRFILDRVLVSDSSKNHQKWIKKFNLIYQLFELDNKAINIESLFEEFTNNTNQFSLVLAYELLFGRLGITDSRHSEVWDKLKFYIEEFQNSPSSLDIRLKEIAKSTNSSIVKGEGIGPGVEIMSVHASKGLEFDSVYLGGVHSNGRSVRDDTRIGETDFSFTWKVKNSDKKMHKTPWLIVEIEENKHKEFSESKRLLYVALTRAKAKLNYINIKVKKSDSLEHVDFISSQSSWIKALRLVENGPDVYKSESYRVQNVSGISVDEDSYTEIESEDEAVSPFLNSKLGIEIRHFNFELGIVGDMSVTKFSEISICPRKFYFQNILKFNEENLNRQYSPEELMTEVDDELSFVPSSTKDRGMKIHFKLHQFLIGKIERDDEIEWTIEQLELYQKEWVSEKEIKFSLFGQMISGTPDCYAYSKDQDCLYIVDFKTGRIEEDKIQKYKTQVMVYGFGLLNENVEKITLSLIFIDEQRNIEFVFTKDELIKNVWMEWQKISNLNKIETAHCSKCIFNSYCQEI